MSPLRSVRGASPDCASPDCARPSASPSAGILVYAERPGRIEVVEAAHPVPDAAGTAAAQRLLDLTDNLSADDPVIALISGGGSSLLTLPTVGLRLLDKPTINRALLHSGAAIDEMNCVRKHLSAIKADRLAGRCAPAQWLTLAISDVPGDDLSVIASGPTVTDTSTCADALAIIDRYQIALPAVARAGLESGAFETPKPGDVRLAGQQARIIATPQFSLEAAAALARSAGLAAHILSDEIEGESHDIGRMPAALARAVTRRGAPFAAPCVILSAGKTTVTVRKTPCQVLARGAALGLSAADALNRHDACGHFAALGDRVVTGPTHTNLNDVNDFRALLIL